MLNKYFGHFNVASQDVDEAFFAQGSRGNVISELAELLGNVIELVYGDMFA